MYQGRLIAVTICLGIVTLCCGVPTVQAPEKKTAAVLPPSPLPPFMAKGDQLGGINTWTADPNGSSGSITIQGVNPPWVQMVGPDGKCYRSEIGKAWTEVPCAKPPVDPFPLPPPDDEVEKHRILNQI